MIEQLIAWAIDAGAYLEPIELRVGGDGGRGLFMRRPASAGELLLRIPQRLVITHDVTTDNPIGGTLAAFEGKLHSRHVLSGVWLALERADPSSPWRPYIDALPADFSYMPTLRTADELAALEGTRALTLILQWIEHLRTDLTVVTDLIDEARELPRESMVWGHHASRSRSFHTPDAVWTALVPIADMANHGTRAARFAFGAGGDFEVRATTDLREGDEVRHDYGRHSNAQWLVGYGFALPENPDDEVELSFSSPPRQAFVGAEPDHRFRVAVAIAASELGHRDHAALVGEIRAAAQRATAAIAAAPRPAGKDTAWDRTCEMVRAGELAVLARIAERADELCAAEPPT